MFFVHDINGLQHAFSGKETKVGLRPEGIARIADSRSLGVGEQQLDWKPPSFPASYGAAHSQNRKERQRLWLVAQIMSKPVVHVRANLSLVEAAKLLKKGRLRHLPVTSEEERVIGVISQRDVLITQAERPALQKLTVLETMTREVLTARPNAGIREVASTMLDARVGCLPIVDETGSLVGIVTRSDILRTIVQHAPLELWG